MCYFYQEFKSPVNEILRFLFAIPQKTKQKQTHIYSSSGLEPFNLIKKTVSRLCEIYLIIDVVLIRCLSHIYICSLSDSYNRLFSLHFLWASKVPCYILSCLVITFDVTGAFITLSIWTLSRVTYNLGLCKSDVFWVNFEYFQMYCVFAKMWR